jgi:hypothetical protein
MLLLFSTHSYATPIPYLIPTCTCDYSSKYDIKLVKCLPLDLVVDCKTWWLPVLLLYEDCCPILHLPKH